MKTVNIGNSIMAVVEGHFTIVGKFRRGWVNTCSILIFCIYLTSGVTSPMSEQNYIFSSPELARPERPETSVPSYDTRDQDTICEFSRETEFTSTIWKSYHCPLSHYSFTVFRSAWL